MNALLMLLMLTPPAGPEVRLITVDPGHFHAALVQKEMLPGISPTVAVYAPLGPDLIEHLKRISGYNLRKENPAAWKLEIHTGPDFFERMLKEKPGNVVMFSGRNRVKMDRIKASVEAGLNVLADKPWVIRAEDLPKLESALNTAERKGLVAYDVMTERYEISTILQKELVNDPAVFGQPIAGTPAEPGVYMESIHHLMKMVSGAPNLRPAWFFDVAEQGEGLSDVGTHLVDMVAWTLFPQTLLDHKKDAQVLAAKRWPTTMTREQYQRVTNLPLAAEKLDYFCNTQVTYALRGIHVKFDVLWNYEAPNNGPDTHIAIYRGSKADVEVRQATDHEVWVTPKSPDVRAALQKRIAALQTAWPGVALEERGQRIRVTFPQKYRVGHEAHFAQVTERFLEYMKNPKSMPAWEKANMLAKYYVTTKGVELSKKESGR